MTKKQCKNKVAKLREKRLEIDEQIIHFERQTKLLDAEDSQRLLKKYNIESEELAELLMNRGRSQERRQVSRAVTSPGSAGQQKAGPEETEVKPIPETKEKNIPAQLKTEPQLKAKPETMSAPDPQPVKEPHSSIMDSFLKEAAQ